jgi:hypothetical protein
MDDCNLLIAIKDPRGYMLYEEGQKPLDVFFPAYSAVAEVIVIAFQRWRSFCASSLATNSTDRRCAKIVSPPMGIH